MGLRAYDAKAQTDPQQDLRPRVLRPRPRTARPRHGHAGLLHGRELDRRGGQLFDDLHRVLPFEHGDPLGRLEVEDRLNVLLVGDDRPVFGLVILVKLLHPRNGIEVEKAPAHQSIRLAWTVAVTAGVVPPIVEITRHELGRMSLATVLAAAVRPG